MREFFTTWQGDIMHFSQISYIGVVHELYGRSDWKNQFYFEIIAHAPRQVRQDSWHLTHHTRYATEFEARAVRAVLIVQVQEYRERQP